MINLLQLKYNIIPDILFNNQKIKMHKGGRVCGKTYQEKPEHDLQFPFYDKKRDSDKKIGKVILSIRQGQSYERKFLDYQQQSEKHQEIILVGVVMGLKFAQIAAMFTGNPEGTNYKLFWKALKQVPRQMVLINFQNSSGFCLGDFGDDHHHIYTILQICKQKSYAVSFSAYSLMSFLNSWEEAIFGPNPFNQIKIVQKTYLEIKVDRDMLRSMNSSFHGALAEMLTGDTLVLQSAQQGLIFCRNPQNQPKQYKIKVLSANLSYPSTKEDQNCQIFGSKGSFGHLALDYPCGFRLFMSTCHLCNIIKMPITKGSLNSAVQKFMNPIQKGNFLQAIKTINPNDQKSLCIQANKLLNQLPQI